MTNFFDTSALGAAYLGEAGRRWTYELLFESGQQAVVSELADVELPSLLRRAVRNHVITDEKIQAALGLYDFDTGSDGLIGLLRLTPSTLAAARQIALDEAIGSLDAIHLASALLLRRQLSDEPVAVVTLDRRQATAARRLGFRVVGDLADTE